MRDFALVFTECLAVPVRPFLQPVPAFHCTGHTSTAPNLVLFINLLGVHSSLMSRSLMKMLNGTVTMRDPSGIALGFGHQLDSELLITGL